MKPTLRQLEYVVAIDDHGSFSHAARACGVTQPALSMQINRLETVLGVSLFERRPGGLLTTEAGTQLIEGARRVLAEVDATVAAAQTLQDPFRGTIRLGVIPTVAPYLLPEVMPMVRERFPELRLLLREERTDELIRLLEAGELDVLLVALESELGDLVTAPLFTDPFVLAVARHHRLAKRRRVAAEEEA